MSVTMNPLEEWICLQLFFQYFIDKRLLDTMDVSLIYVTSAQTLYKP